MRALLLSPVAAARLTSRFPAAGAKPGPRPERLTFRVTRLFAPDRVKDLREAFATVPDVRLVGGDFDFAEITVEFVPGKAFPGAAPKDLPAALGGRLGQASNHTF